MPTITDRTNGLYDDHSQFKTNLVSLTNGVDENVFVNEAGTVKNYGILRGSGSGIVITLAGSGSSTGDVEVYVVFLNATLGESFRSMPSTVKTATASSNLTIALTGIPTSDDTQVTTREIYWTQAGDTEAKLGWTINDNTTTTMVAQNIADATGRNLADPPSIWKRQVFPKCKYNIIYDGRMMMLNQSDNRIVPVYRDDDAYDLSAVTSTTVVLDSALTSLDFNAVNVFVGMRVKMLDGDAQDEIRTISGYNSGTGEITVSVAFTAIPAIGDTYEIHGHLNTSTLYYSEQFAYEGYDDGSDGEGVIATIDFDIGDGTEATGMATFSQERGDSTLGDLVVFKQNKVFFMSGLPTGWKRRLISDHYGCIANKSIVSILGKIYFLGNKMIFRIDSTGRIEEIGIPIYSTLFSEINWDIADTSQGVHYKDMYLLAVPFGASAYPNRILAFNYRFNTWHIWDFGLNITAMNRDFADDGEELLEIAFWDVNNSNAFIWKFDPSATNDNGSNTEYTATSGTATTIADTTQSWTTDEWQSRTVTIIEGLGVGQSQQIVSNTADTITVPDNWTTNPDNTSIFAIGLKDYWYVTPDIQVGTSQGARGTGSGMKLGIRPDNAVDGDKLEFTQYESFSDTQAHDPQEYPLGDSGSAPEDLAYLNTTVDLNTPNMRFKVRSKRPGQNFGFRSASLLVKDKDDSM